MKVSGVVRDAETKETLLGVSVVIKGLRQGTVTDVNGQFVLNAEKGSVLQLSYVGFESQEIVVTSSQKFDIKLRSTATKMNELVVIGYGTAKKSQVVGSVSTVKSDELTKQPLLTAAQGLQGKTTGIQIIASGDPGGQPQVRIRGTNTITADANPIYVVDGVIVSDITNINTNDIESMDVLKDAASQAIYGSRAANGVVLVTTKAGKSGKTKVSFDSYVGFRTMTSKVKMADAKTYAQYTNEARAYDGQPAMGEVYLMNAEAANEKSQTSKAQTSLNAVRNRAGLANTTASSQTDLRTAIWKERRVELAMEHGGRRVSDYAEEIIE